MAPIKIVVECSVSGELTLGPRITQKRVTKKNKIREIKTSKSVKTSRQTQEGDISGSEQLGIFIGRSCIKVLAS